MDYSKLLREEQYMACAIYQCPNIESESFKNVHTKYAMDGVYKYLRILNEKYPLYHVDWDNKDLLIPYLAFLEESMAEPDPLLVDTDFPYSDSYANEPHVFLLHFLLENCHNMCCILPGVDKEYFEMDSWSKPSLYTSTAQFLIAQPLDVLDFIRRAFHKKFISSCCSLLNLTKLNQSGVAYKVSEIELAWLERNRSSDIPIQKHLRYETYFPSLSEVGEVGEVGEV